MAMALANTDVFVTVRVWAKIWQVCTKNYGAAFIDSVRDDDLVNGLVSDSGTP